MAYYKQLERMKNERLFLYELPWDPEEWWQVPVSEQHPHDLSWAPPEYPELVDVTVDVEEDRKEVQSVRHKKDPSDDPNAVVVRGMSMGKGTSKAVKNTAKIMLDFYDAVNGPKDKKVNEKVARNIGATTRNKVHILAPKFFQLEKTEMYRVVVGLKEHFVWNNDDLSVRRWVMKTPIDKYSHFKTDCSKVYKKWGNRACEVILKDFAHGCNTSWTWLCQHFSSDEFQRRSRANTRNRAKLSYLHRGGPHPISYHVQDLIGKSNMFHKFKAFDDMYVKGAQSGNVYELHNAPMEEANRRVEAYMQ